MCAMFSPFAVGYASFSFLHLAIIRFLVYWLIILFDLIVSTPHVLQHSQRFAAKENRDTGRSFRPQIESETLASQAASVPRLYSPALK